MFVLKTLVCVESVLKTVPELKNCAEAIEQLSRDCFYNLNLNLNLNSLLVKRQIDNPSPGAVTGGN